MIKKVLALLLLSSTAFFSLSSCDDEDEDKQPNDSDSTYVDLTVSGTIGGYSYVDLGLASGTKWATYNVGASNPTEFGDHFAWGETSAKDSYTWANYKYESDDYKALNNGYGSKYGCCKYTITDRGSLNQTVAWLDNNGDFIGDSLQTLLPEDDAATANWGTDWRMPTSKEQQELIDGCNWEWTDNFNGSGVAGKIGTSKVNGNTIFLPASGLYDTERDSFPTYGGYWSSTISGSCQALLLPVGVGDDTYNHYNYRNYGLSVRAVISNSDNDLLKVDTVDLTVSGSVDGYNYVDLGLTSGIKWATCNVGASNPTGYGNYFAWGETSSKKIYNNSTYKWCVSERENELDSLLKYNFSYKGVVDSIGILEASDDAATANWGDNWRMPTVEEQKELLDGCNWMWTKNINGSGIAGYIGTSKVNGHVIFLPASGYTVEKDTYAQGLAARYWSSSVFQNISSEVNYIYLDESQIDWALLFRDEGCSVRAVTK